MPLAAPAPSNAQGCARPPASPLVVNVKHKGAKGNGRADDTAAIQRAIDEIAGTGGTVLVPNGTYMVRTIGKKPVTLKDNMTFKLQERATLKAIPNSSKVYAVLTISGATDIVVVGGTLEGDRKKHTGKGGEWGMGIRIERGAKRILISGLTVKEMWGDGFYVDGATDVTFCGVTADHNRRQGLSIIDARGVLVTHSVFKNTRGTRPSDGIDLEPNTAAQTITNVRIENSKFLDNGRNGIEIAGKRGTISKIEIVGNLFQGNRPILVENAPLVRSTAFCGNRLVGYEQSQPAGGLNAFAEPVEIVALQSDCRGGRDMRFEVKRQTKKRKKRK